MNRAANLPLGFRGALLIALVVAALDRGSKVLVQRYIDGQIPVLGDFFTLVHVYNTGAAWGMLAGRAGLLALLSVVVLAVLLWQHRRFADGWGERYLALGLLCGGIVGNLYDRLFLRGVVDFLSFDFGFYRWPAFNVADIGICVGVVLFILSTWLRPDVAKSETRAAGDESQDVGAEG